jgi:Holliday junction DNA helicase RuvA
MIAFLQGEVVEVGLNRVVLDVGGVGYELVVPSSLLSALAAVGGRARVHTRMVVREDSMTLYGFPSPDERELFDLLTGVTGVGPKVALAFLSVLRPAVLTRAIANGDAAALTVVPGVGKKVAQRVVLDLAEKLGGDAELPSEGPMADVREALLSLGLNAAEAGEAMRGIEADGREADDILREALQKVGR